MSKIIAIDFDGTITDDSPYPNIGKIRVEAKYYIEKLYNDGYTLILWTCRSGYYLEEAINLLSDNDILKCFKYINRNDINNLMDPRKIVADFYIDDRSIPGDIDWNIIYNYIINKLGEKS